PAATRSPGTKRRHARRPPGRPRRPRRRARNATRYGERPARPAPGPRAGHPRPDPRRSGPPPPVGVRVDPRPDHEARDGPDEAVPPRAQEDREEDADRRTRHQTDGRVTEAPV